MKGITQRGRTNIFSSVLYLSFIWNTINPQRNADSNIQYIYMACWLLATHPQSHRKSWYQTQPTKAVEMNVYSCCRRIHCFFSSTADDYSYIIYWYDIYSSIALSLMIFQKVSPLQKWQNVTLFLHSRLSLPTAKFETLWTFQFLRL